MPPARTRTTGTSPADSAKQATRRSTAAASRSPCPRPPRLTVDNITSDQLDQLYERVAKAEQDADDSVTAAGRLTTLVGKRSERAERAAKEQRRRAESAETELFTLRCGIRALGGDPTTIQNLWAQIRLRNRQWREEKQRAERAEAAIARVREYLNRHAHRVAVTPIDVLAALNETKEPTS